MKKIYICHTVYHLLITIIKISIMREQRRSIIILANKIVNIDDLCKRTNKEGILCFKLDETSSTPTTVDTITIDLIIETNGTIYLFNDDTSVARQIVRAQKNYHLIEDGYNCFQAKLLLGGSVVKRVIKTYLFKKYVPYGFSKYCLSIEVNSLVGLPHDIRSKKYKELPRKKLFDSLNKEQKSLIFKIFKTKPLTITPKSVLLLTQPLAQDKCYKTPTERFQSIQEQYDYFDDIVQEYRTLGYNVYLKVHPRDVVDYSKLRVELLPSNIPMEIIELMLTGRFECGITHSSTALDFLTCVDKKITLVDLKDIK